MNTLHRSEKSQARPVRKGLHPRNLHNQGYDFPALVKSHPALATHVKPNAHGNLSIDFADPLAVKTLNAALLNRYYDIVDWDIPEGALCPPIPGRADYIHYMADLLELGPGCEHPSIKLLDIGTGANGIYPLLACQLYGWQCVGSDINSQSLENVATILTNNPTLKDRFTLRTQHDKNHIFEGIIQAGEFFDVSVCNPPFHASLDEALKGSQLKLNNLARSRGEQKAKTKSPTLNFGGEGAELWCKGGEQLFLKKLIRESQVYATQCRWFSSLVSKADNVKPAKKLIRKLGAVDSREIEMKQGNKITRILAWTFM
ncbi:23S rRNA (adenine(1618)-N(6))-methyltransferase RlmF [Vreelandella neptunia]|uniref:Ribosomal RNA large subunit methyltransferase F n=1 Tax=Vreelandella neptunia TaxID=115551 RepID=A0ABZ0YR59_9GAMM|nr:23S rRNA (adenine(1618)-N(6))-methyltransferase RlmF [Halomonas neptunia]MDN3561503.1 23S rRNA (adenine(1618)-N(6))-methyltransferase RlmF [Halomonas neptunia]TDV99534.1 23S rRNA (adenine1618-N6)-methyltransferase [Halomonas alkaliantarctica]WQH14653.1 23S rRNA (adenine(1618)-N(6))-methyltransferase RlmF [Halomonas neptunia]